MPDCDLSPWMARPAFRLLAVSALCALPWIAAAMPLDKSACDELSREMQALRALDAEKLMAQDPAIAIQTLSPGDLSIVKRYIEVDEQIRFRCTPASALVALKGLEEDEDGNPAQSKPEKKTAENAVPDKQGRKGKKAKAEEPAGAGDEAGGVPPAKTKSKTAAKQKATNAKADAVQ